MKLRESFQHCMSQVGECVDRFPWEDPNLYANWLAQTFYFVSHSTRLLATASSRFPIGQDQLHYRFAKHIVEESKHEVLAVSDLKKLGRDISEFYELPETSAFYQSQYYWIERVNPISFFGYVLMLEGIAVTRGPIAAQRIEKALGNKCVSFLKVHGEEDIGHLEEAFEQLEGLDEKSLDLVTQNLNLSSGLYCSMLEQIQKSKPIQFARKVS